MAPRGTLHPAQETNPSLAKIVKTTAKDGQRIFTTKPRYEDCHSDDDDVTSPNPFRQSSLSLSPEKPQHSPVVIQLANEIDSYHLGSGNQGTPVNMRQTKVDFNQSILCLG